MHERIEVEETGDHLRIKFVGDRATFSRFLWRSSPA
jgi:hypothetical protein